MVRIMSAPMTRPQQQQQQAGFEYVNFREEGCDAVIAGCGGGAQAVWSGNGGEEAPSSADSAASCIFWSAIAVGGLVQGAPVESVSRTVHQPSVVRHSSNTLGSRSSSGTVVVFHLVRYCVRCNQQLGCRHDVHI